MMQDSAGLPGDRNSTFPPNRNEDRRRVLIVGATLAREERRPGIDFADPGMRKLTPVLIAVATIAVVAAAALRLTNEQRPWTTSSEAALEEFEQGLTAEKKVYWNEAREHFARAVELDPDFAIARMKLLQLSTKGEERASLILDLARQTDLERLSPRERLLMQHRVAMIERDRARADRLVDAYLAKHPEDLYALTIRCDRAWMSGDLDEAERCYTKLIRLDPNWVFAQNHLGYIRMAKGEFQLAEQAFASYGRIAPDQANPHDSLGELLMLTGRYGEATGQFERAVSIRSDFCASWSHLIDIALLEGDVAKAAATLARAREAVCPPQFIEAQQCRIDLWENLRGGGAAAAANWTRGAACPARNFDFVSLSVLQRAALTAGEGELARPVETSMGELAGKYDGDPIWGAVHGHLDAQRRAYEGDTAGAIAALRRADERLSYNGDGIGLFRLYNRLVLASLLERTGAGAEAAKLRAEVAAVNARMAELFATVPAI